MKKTVKYLLFTLYELYLQCDFKNGIEALFNGKSQFREIFINEFKQLGYEENKV
jgi:hypothetical protein